MKSESFVRRWSELAGVYRVMLLCGIFGLAVQRAGGGVGAAQVEVDHFPNTTAQITLQYQGDQTEQINLVGPTTVHVMISPEGQAFDQNQNGRDEVQTEIVAMQLVGNSASGPVVVRLHPEHRSFGRIEERTNNTPGILDLPPFTPAGNADSFFDVFVEIEFEGRKLQPAQPLRVDSVIRHKPPARGDRYISPFQPIELLDENGLPTGIRIVQEIHTPDPIDPPPVEVDHFPHTTARIRLQYQGGQTENVDLAGPTTVRVLIPPNGSALDFDGDGRDQVQTEMTWMSLVGNSSLGPVKVVLNPDRPSLGEIEERTNNTPGILDVPPFAPDGTADSFFDVFVEIHVDGQTLRPEAPLHMQSIIRHKPPAPGDQYVNPFTQPIELLDSLGNRTGIFVVEEVHTPNPTDPPPVEIDHFPNTTARITLQYAGGQTENVNLTGPTTVHVQIPPDGAALDTDADGLDQVQTEMIAMTLVGNSAMGLVTINLDPLRPSLGEIEERTNNTPGTLDVPPFTPMGSADSFFDVFVEIQVAGNTLRPLRPLHMRSVIRHKPPGPGDEYENPFTAPVELVDENGQPTGIFVVQEIHTPNPTNPPPIEIDHFPHTTGQIVLQYPNGGTEQVNLSGPTTVRVLISSNGVAFDTDGDNLEQVPTEIVEMNLTGASGMGPVRVRLDPSRPSLGQIQERFNNTPGILDVPPFTETGLADSFFDVFVEIEIGTQRLFPAQPLRMRSVIRHKPPAPGDTYVNPFLQPVELLDGEGKPTGIRIVREVHTPNPTNPPPVEIDHFPHTTAQITLRFQGGETEEIDLVGPTTVRVMIPPDGQAIDTDRNGRDDVRTEMTLLQLVGSSPLGPVRVRLDPEKPSLGAIEERVNFTPGTLDVPPFTALGTADSFFDIWPIIEVGDQVLRPAMPLHMRSIIRHKPPARGDRYVNPFTQPVPLLDENGNPTGIEIVQEIHTPNPTNPPPVEVDHFPNTTARVVLQYEAGGTEQVDLSGPTTVRVLIPPSGMAFDTDGDGLDQVRTEMTALSLSGQSTLGPVFVTLNPARASLGEIEERTNNTPGTLDVPPFTPVGTADSFFDVFVEIRVAGQTLRPPGPLHMRSVIRHKPPATGDTYINPFDPVPLLDANGNLTGIRLVQEIHTPNPTNPPPIEVDHFPNTTARIILAYPGGGTEQVQLSGPTTVHVLIPPHGAALDTDGDGRDQVRTEMVEMKLTGDSAMGLVTVNLDPMNPSMGEIEERNNNTPGILDVPPFTKAGTADSFFEVYAQIHIGDQTLFPARPFLMRSVIRHKPPAPGDTYINPFTQPVELLDAFGNPTGIRVLREIHTPNPETNCIVSIICPPSITVTSVGPAIVFFTVTATDSCGDPVTLTVNPPSGSLFPIGTTPVTAVASSANGVASCTFTVTVVPKRRILPGGNTLPPTNSVYISPPQWHALYANGIYVSNVIHRAFTATFPPPQPGTTNVESFGSKVDLMYSTDGRTFNPFTGDANCTVQVVGLDPQGSTQVFDTEMLRLDVMGGTLPPGVQLRESPSLPSTGQTRISPVPGGFQISSFFDVWTELSLDGGQTWSPSPTAGHMELHIDPANPPTSLALPGFAGNEASFSIATQPGLRYTVQYKNSLTDPVWTTLEVIAGDGSTKLVADIVPPGLLHRFYLVLVEEDPNQ